ncbi:hypothetical protein LC612_29290 [Nostoc sp. CHAB 5834]|nr:hypothetical protein [Nostoc sp. CHAB 5834]
MHKALSTAQYSAAASYLLTAVVCFLALNAGMLPGLLAVCLGYMQTVGLMRVADKQGFRIPKVAAAAVCLYPLLLLLWLGFAAKGASVDVVGQYQELLNHLATTVSGIRDKLPPDLASQLPEGLAAIQEWVADQLFLHAKGVAVASKPWFHGALLAYVGLIVGSLIGASQSAGSKKPLASALRARAQNFQGTFAQIVAAQFWIAAFNSLLTAGFLKIALPLFGITMPYGWALVGLTFVAGLIPVVGNLLCNAVLALVGLSVSPVVGVASLVFLIVIHKAEYAINAKVVGAKTKTTAWELLAVMFAGEALFGVGGLVAAPLYYAYAKKELADAGLV